MTLDVGGIVTVVVALEVEGEILNGKDDEEEGKIVSSLWRCRRRHGSVGRNFLL